jgi:hypothetical protein
MSVSIQEKLANLRKLKEERERLTQEIKTMQENMSAIAASGANRPRITSWDRHQLSMAADTQTTASWVQEDFENFHRDKIENKLKSARAKVLIGGIMSDADAAYQARVRALGVDNLASLQEADQVIGTRKRSLKAARNNPLLQPHTATKRIVISADPHITTNNLAQRPEPKPGQIKSRSAKRSAKVSSSDARTTYSQTQLAEDNGDETYETENEFTEDEFMEVVGEDDLSETMSCAPTELSSGAASVLGDNEKCQVISEYLDLAYAKIIKIVKVYFIRALYFDYQMPAQSEILELKDRLLGHLHIPRQKWRTRLPLKSRIEYLNITRDGRVELASGWVMRIRGWHLYVSHDMTGGGKGVKNKWRKLTPHFPVFHKITNSDINTDCGFRDMDQNSETSSQSDYSELVDMTDVETDPEYTSVGEEYDSDD